MRYRHLGLTMAAALAAVSAAGSEDPLQVRCSQLHDKADQPVIVELTGPKEWLGKRVALLKGGTTVCEGKFTAEDGRAAAKLSFDPLPWGVRPDVLDVAVEGDRQAQFTAPLVFIGMRGNPPRDEVLAAMKLPGGVFPMIDRFGQYRHRQWPGKIQTLDDLRRHREAEQKDLKEHPGPQGWDTYGGWLDGPPLKATGFFRVEKFQGRWWLVDPDGSLFWSHGIDCVRATSGATPIADRMHYFEPFPAAGTPEAQFLGRQS
nr:hypothetical protein [Candidatus Anammoximicrobium sp.]